jgi:hypothetical protein
MALFLAAPTLACPPKWVNARTVVKPDQGSVKVFIQARQNNVSVRIVATDLAPLVSGELTLALRGAGPERELSSFPLQPDESGVTENVEFVDDDLRFFMMNADSVAVYDGETLLGSAPLEVSAGLRFRARKGGPDQLQFRLRGRAISGTAQGSRYKMEAEINNAPPGARYTFVLAGGGIVDMEFEVKADGNGAALVQLQDSIDLVTMALDWTHVVVKKGEAFVASMPLECQ